MTEFSVQMPPTTQVMDPNVAAAAAAQFCDQVLASLTIMFLPSWESDVKKRLFMQLDGQDGHDTARHQGRNPGQLPAASRRDPDTEI